MEADLKVTQEVVIDLERDKKDVETMIEKKDKDIHDAMRRLEDEQVIVAKLQKAIKELQGRIETQEEELEAERQVSFVWTLRGSYKLLREICLRFVHIYICFMAAFLKILLKQSVSRLAPRQRSREAASPGSLTTSKREWRRPEEPLRPRWTSTRRGRRRSTS